MLEQDDLKATMLDKMTCSYDLQMLKAALSYFPPSQKRLFSILIKIQELQNTMRLFASPDSSEALSACSAGGDEPKRGFFDVFNEIKDYGSPRQRQIFSRFNTMLQLMYLYEQTAPADPGAAGLSLFQDTASGPAPEEDLSLAAASLSSEPKSKDPAGPPPGDFRTCIRNALSKEQQAVFDSYSAAFRSLDPDERKETSHESFSE